MRRTTGKSGSPEQVHARWRMVGLGLFFTLLALLFALPVLRDFNNWGIQDWDIFFFYHGAPAVVVRDYLQFPLWNPWFCGGMPMLARPESPFLSPLFLLTLWLGPLHALKVQIILHLAIGLGGTYALARHLHASRLAALLTAFIYMLGGTYAQHMAVGNAWAFSMGFIPWAVWCWLRAVGAATSGQGSGAARNFQLSTFNAQRSSRTDSALKVESSELNVESFRFPSALACAAFLVLMWFGGGPYPMVITLLFLAAHTLFGIVTRELRPWRALGLLILVTALTFGLGAVKFLPSLAFTMQYPREADMSTGFSLDSLRFGLFARDQTLHAADALRKGPGFLQGVSQAVNETGSYLGIVPLLLFLVGAATQAKRRRALLLCLLFFLWLSFGTRAAPFSAWDFLHDLPVFSITRVAERFRLVFLLVLALGAGWGLDALAAAIHARRIGNSGLPAVAGNQERRGRSRFFPEFLSSRFSSGTMTLGGCVRLGLVVLVWVDLMLVVSPLFKQAFTIPPFEMPAAPGRAFAQTASHYAIGPRGWATAEDDQALCAWSSHYPALLSNLGIILGNEDNPVPMAAVAMDATDYRGEVYIYGTSGEAAYVQWSPNRLTIRARTGGEGLVVVNQNFYPGWRVHGVPGANVEALNELMAVRVGPGEHVLTLTYMPASFLLGLVLSLVTLGVSAWWLWRVRRGSPAPAWCAALAARMPWPLSPAARVALTLAAATLLVYLPALQSEFVNIDDDVYITENPQVNTGFTLTNIRWAFTSTERSNYWHPLTWISHMLDVEVFGLKPGGHHLTNVLLHVLNSVLLFLVLRALTARGTLALHFCSVEGERPASRFAAEWPPALVAALFALHPLHVESVAWVAERKDVLSTLFGILTIGAYARYARARGGDPLSVIGYRGTAESDHRSPITDHPVFWYFLTLLCFTLSLMSKPMLVTMPVVLLLLDWWPLGRFPPSPTLRRTSQVSGFRFQGSKPGLTPDTRHLPPLRLLLEKLPFLLLALAASLWAFAGQREGEALRSLAQVPLGDRAANALVSYVVYLAKTVWPHPLTVYYPLRDASLPLWQPVGAALLLAAITALAIWQARRRPYLLMGWCWYLVTLLPVIGLVQIGTFARADRYTYVPLIGVFLMVAWGVGERGEGKGFRVQPSPSLRRISQVSGFGAKWVACGLWPVVFLILAILTWRQLGTWKDSETLFTHNLRVAGSNAVAHDGLGFALYSQQHFEEAVPHFQASIALLPSAARTHYRLGLAQAGAGQLDDAIAAYEGALAVADDFTEAWINLGVAVMQLGQADRAVECFEQAVRFEPQNAEAHSNLGIVQCALGRLDEGLQSLQTAVRLMPDKAESRNNLGRALVILGRLQEAESQLRQALMLRPDYAEARQNLAGVLSRLGREEEARAQFQAAEQLVEPAE